MGKWVVVLPTQVGQAKRERTVFDLVTVAVNGGALEISDGQTGDLLRAYGPGFWIEAWPNPDTDFSDAAIDREMQGEGQEMRFARP